VARRAGRGRQRKKEGRGRAGGQSGAWGSAAGRGGAASGREGPLLRGEERPRWGRGGAARGRGRETPNGTSAFRSGGPAQKGGARPPAARA
jgi:hypothetical protein